MGKFHGSHAIPETAYSAAIHGRFRHHNKRVVGALRLHGSFAGGCVDQDTGDLHYVAHKHGT